MYNSSAGSGHVDNTGFAGQMLASDIATEQQLLTIASEILTKKAPHGKLKCKSKRKETKEH